MLNKLNVPSCKNKKINNIDALKYFCVTENCYCNKSFFKYFCVHLMCFKTKKSYV